MAYITHQSRERCRLTSELTMSRMRKSFANKVSNDSWWSGTEVVTSRHLFNQPHKSEARTANCALTIPMDVILPFVSSLLRCSILPSLHHSHIHLYFLSVSLVYQLPSESRCSVESTAAQKPIHPPTTQPPDRSSRPAAV